MSIHHVAHTTYHIPTYKHKHKSRHRKLRYPNTLALPRGTSGRLKSKGWPIGVENVDLLVGRRAALLTTLVSLHVMVRAGGVGTYP
eukprot:444711-Amorphochlora_amoeboformis.AAC.1